jgi:hypothetical protein
MKKPKISLDSAKIQDFFLHHIEKILLVLVIGLTLLLVWQGVSQTGLEPGKTPQGLVSESSNVMTFIDDPNRWTEVSATRAVKMDIASQVAKTQIKTQPEQYFFVNTINRPDFPKLSPRTDPKLFPPTHLVIHAIYGPLASYAKATEVDPLLPPTEAEPLRPAPKPKAKPKTKAGEGLDGYMPPGEGGMPGPAKRGTKTRPNRGEESGELAGMPTPGMGGYGTSPTEIGPYPEAFTTGYLPQAAEQTIARNTYAMVITAVVPFQKQLDEYMSALANSLDYDPARDFPMYLQFGVRRYDVTKDTSVDLDSLPQTAYTDLRLTLAMQEQLYGDEQKQIPPLFAGVPPEVVDPNYLDPVVAGGRLTHPVPPFLVRDLWRLLTHPDVPLATMTLGYTDGTTAPQGTASASPADDIPTAGIMPPAGIGGGLSGSSDSYGGSRFGGMGGMRAPGGEGTAGMGGAGFMPRPAFGGGGMPAPGGYAGSRMGEGSYSSTNQNVAPPKYKLIRFTDTNVEPGKKYRYRLRVFLHDPNHPDIGDPVAQRQGYAAPSAASLHGDVQKRIKEQDAADAKKSKETGRPSRTSWVISDWSDPSDVVELPPLSRFFAMSVHPSSSTPVIVTRDKPPVPIPNDQPKATSLAVVWDRIKVADVPAEVEKVCRGTVFNFVQDTKVIHPVTKQVIDLTKYAFVTDALVVDMMGGEKITSLDKTLDHSLVAPGELLIFDSRGNLHVQNETDDIEQIRVFAIRKPDPAKPTTAGTDTGLAPGEMPTPARGRPPARRSTGCF